MISHAKLTPGPGFRPIKAVLYYSMRLLPFVWSRRLISFLLASGINLLSRKTTVIDLSDNETNSNTTVIQALREKGWAPLKPLLSATQTADILSFLGTKEPVGIGRGSYQLNDVLRCPHVLSAINHPTVLRIARAYLGCPPTISSIGIHLTIPTIGQPVSVQRFHRDADEWKFFKLIVYLSDVDEESGPHEFVEGSQRSSGSILSVPYAEDAVYRSYGRDKIRKIVGGKGTTFIADTWGIHRGNIPTSRPRLVLQVQYSLLPITMFDYKPLNIAFPKNIDRCTNRLLLA